MQPNIANLDKVLDVVLENPENYDQSTFGCDTSFCIVGWAAMLEAKERGLDIKTRDDYEASAFQENLDSIIRAGEKYLGIDELYFSAMILENGDNTMEDIFSIRNEWAGRQGLPPREFDEVKWRETRLAKGLPEREPQYYEEKEIEDDET